ncbi:MAG TPA: hypothetical protein VHR86_05175, partial [Armatimonadota bacterium]|nr:hypothetical protein [Armatimonadota bacterium]
ETEQRMAAYQKRMDDLTSDAAKLKTAMGDSANEVKEAQKAYKQYGDELSRNNLEGAIGKQQNLKNQLKDTEYAIKNTQKAFHSYSEDARKEDNSGGIMSGLKRAGIYKMLSDSLSQAGGTFIQSAIGLPQATLYSSVLSGIGQGAAMGSLTGTPVGTAVSLCSLLFCLPWLLPCWLSARSSFFRGKESLSRGAAGWLWVFPPWGPVCCFSSR